MHTMWSRAVASDSGIGPNADRHAVSRLLDNTPMRTREPRVLAEEGR